MKKLTLSITSLFLIITCFSSCKQEGLDVNNDEEIKIMQRGSKVINGSEGDVDLKITDITANATEVTIEGIENGKVYFQKQLSIGDEGYFEYGKKYYRIKITQFEDHMMHEDFAFIAFHTVSEEKGKARLDVVELKTETKITPDQIRRYLEKIKTSGLTFIRNGESWPDSSMADLLESKYTINREDIKTKEDFVQKVVQTSSSTGETYRVIAGNDTLTLVNWLGL